MTLLVQSALAGPVAVSPEYWAPGDEVELPAPDRTIKRYRIIQKLREGAMGLAFQAEEFPYAVFESEPQKLRTIKVRNPNASQSVGLEEELKYRSQAFVRIFPKGMSPAELSFRHIHFQFAMGRFAFWEDGKRIEVPIQVSDYVEHTLSDKKIASYYQVNDLLPAKESAQPGLWEKMRSLLPGQKKSEDVSHRLHLERTLEIKTNLLLLYAHHHLRGLAPLHVADYLHLDLKPGNALMRGSLYDFMEGVKVEHVLTDLDGLFDLRRPADQQPVLITPAFAAPEAHRLQRVTLQPTPDIGTELTGATDLYSLGSSVYHLMTGYPPVMDPELIEGLVSEDQVILDVLSADGALHEKFRKRVGKKLDKMERELFAGNQISRPDLLQRFRVIKNLILGCLHWDPRDRIRFFRNPSDGVPLVIMKNSRVFDSGLGRFLVEIPPETLWLKKVSDEKAVRKSGISAVQCLGDSVHTELLRAPFKPQPKPNH